MHSVGFYANTFGSHTFHITIKHEQLLVGIVRCLNSANFTDIDTIRENKIVKEVKIWHSRNLNTSKNQLFDN